MVVIILLEIWLLEKYIGVKTVINKSQKIVGIIISEIKKMREKWKVIIGVFNVIVLFLKIVGIIIMVKAEKKERSWVFIGVKHVTNLFLRIAGINFMVIFNIYRKFFIGVIFVKNKLIKFVNIRNILIKEFNKEVFGVMIVIRLFRKIAGIIILEIVYMLEIWVLEKDIGVMYVEKSLTKIVIISILGPPAVRENNMEIIGVLIVKKL